MTFDMTEQQQSVMKLVIALCFSLLLFAVLVVAWLGLGRLDQSVALPLLLTIASIWFPSPISLSRNVNTVPIVNVQMTPGEYGPNVMTTVEAEPLRRGNIVKGSVPGPVSPSSTTVYRAGS